MPTVMNQVHPFFQVHDRHPLLHGFSWLALCLLLLVAFLLAVMPGAWVLMSSQDCTGAAAQVHS
jgi:hypothetical protein